MCAGAAGDIEGVAARITPAHDFIGSQSHRSQFFLEQRVNAWEHIAPVVSAFPFKAASTNGVERIGDTMF